jgi:hypothetical protein
MDAAATKSGEEPIVFRRFEVVNPSRTYLMGEGFRQEQIRVREYIKRAWLRFQKTR